MELLADRDPEEARRLLDPVLERMMEAVHRYEGTVKGPRRGARPGHRPGPKERRRQAGSARGSTPGRASRLLIVPPLGSATMRLPRRGRLIQIKLRGNASHSPAQRTQGKGSLRALAPPGVLKKRDQRRASGAAASGPTVRRRRARIGGKDVRSLPLLKRKEIVQQALQSSQRVQPVQ
jgi:hypothetical protein